MEHTVVHFEIPANDPAKLAQFYQKLFGWKFQKDAHMDYWLIETAPQGKGVNGGMMKRMDPHQPVLNYIGVESVDTFTKQVESLGGKVFMPKQGIPGVGYFAVVTDPDGNPLGLFQDDPKAK